MMDTTTWKEFVLSDIFEIKKGKRLTKANQTEGDTIFIGATALNNGITAYIGQEAIHEGNTISLTYNGSIGEAFYQKEPFWASDDVNVLYSKGFTLNERLAMFFCAILRHEKQMWSYARKWNLDQMNNTVIKLPADKDGRLDLEYISSYIDSLDDDVSTIPDYFLDEGYDKACWYLDNIDQEEFEREYAGKQTNKKISLQDRQWKIFQVEQVFNILNGKGITSTEIEDHIGEFPTVQSGETNNGLLGYIDLEYCKEMNYTFYEGPCLTVARSGASGYVSFQAAGCCVGDSAKILVLKTHPQDEKEVLLFLKTILMQNKFKYMYARKVTEDIYKADEILLPITDNSLPDYQFMAEYIKTLPFSKKI